ncbi:MAG: Endonuclease/Exonuclease/phosphatase family protein [Phycisphaerales bacterium]|nr:Endonuclease/Exonuclease/phosphatase family protein [Phycisphaerales bacterium]
MPSTRRPIAAVAALLASWFALPAAAADDVVTVATYNVEHFQSHFYAHELQQKLSKEKQADSDLKEMLYQLRHGNDEDNWETAQVIADPAVNPDVLVIEEGCTQDNLEFFNKRWLEGAYATVMTFPTNTGERNQHLNMLLKPGFKVLKRLDKYRDEPDPTQPERKLFARGPAFCLVQTPSGYAFWVGVTHQKSKLIGFGREEEAALRQQLAGQPKAEIAAKVVAARNAAGKATAEWRNREATRTHAIMKELAAGGDSDDVLLLGDMNDSVGKDEYEELAGADAIDLLVGPPADGFALATKSLVDAKAISFGGYDRDQYRSLIDHAVATPAMKDQILGVTVFQGGLAKVASDHFPVVLKVKCDPAKPTAATAAKPEK